MVLTGREKATIFLSILGAEVSSRVLRYLPDELADLIAAGINHLPSPSPDALSEVMADFQGFLALPETKQEISLSSPAQPQKSFTALLYERPQMAAFIISLLPDDERRGAFMSLSRDKTTVEELLQHLRPNPLRTKLAEKLQVVFAGKIF